MWYYRIKFHVKTDDGWILKFDNFNTEDIIKAIEMCVEKHDIDRHNIEYVKCQYDYE